MLVDTPGIRTRLHRLVDGLATPSLHEELVQEAMVHLWHAEERFPGKSDAWYLQSCRFHLQNLVRQGRSVDSFKRLRSQVLSQEQTAGGIPLELVEPNASIWEEVTVNDVMAELCQWLAPPEQKTLHFLMDGLSAREAAQHLNISHTLVNRHRAQIAALAQKLGL